MLEKPKLWQHTCCRSTFVSVYLFSFFCLSCLCFASQTVCCEKKTHRAHYMEYRTKNSLRWNNDCINAYKVLHGQWFRIKLWMSLTHKCKTEMIESLEFSRAIRRDLTPIWCSNAIFLFHPVKKCEHHQRANIHFAFHNLSKLREQKQKLESLRTSFSFFLFDMW